MEIHKDDVLEHALSRGIASAANRFSVPESLVVDVVKAFKVDIEDTDGNLCSCELARTKGVTMMCFVCDRTFAKERIRI